MQPVELDTGYAKLKCMQGVYDGLGLQTGGYMVGITVRA